MSRLGCCSAPHLALGGEAAKLDQGGGAEGGSVTPPIQGGVPKCAKEKNR